MPALNMFKIYPQQKAAMLKYISDKGLKHIQTKTLTENGFKYGVSLYFSTVPKKSFVKWIKHLQELFSIDDKKIDNYSAVMLIESTGLLYAVCYGTAHFIVSRFADLDFGIDFGSRVLSKYTIKNAREFGGKTTKSIITYNHINELVFESGESVNYIKGNPFDPKKWGKTMSCGQSVQLRKRDFSPSLAPKLASMMEDVILTAPIKTQIPRSIRVQDIAIKVELTDQLIKDMKAGNYMVSISDQQLSGVEFLFNDAFTYHISFKEGEAEIDSELTLEKVKEIAKKHFDLDFRAFLSANVEAREDGVRTFTKKMIGFIDYIDSKNKYYLENGEWFEFDANYLKNLHSAVELIPVTNKPEIEHFNEKEYRAWLKTNKKDPKDYYREKYLNQLLSVKYGYQNYDRKPFFNDKHNIEIADLVKDDIFTFVKIGKVQKLNYVIDQSINALNVLKRSGLKMVVDGKSRRIKTICIWLFLDRQNQINSLVELRSLIFLMKLTDWRKEVLLSGLAPLVKISYKQ